MPGTADRDVPPRPVAAALALAAIVLTVAGGAVHIGGLRPTAEFASGSPAVPPDTASDAWWGFLLALCTGAGLFLGTAAAGWVWRSPAARTVIRFAATATLIATAAHIVENMLLLAAAESTPPAAWVPHIITATAVLKYTALLPAAVVSVSGAAVLVWRCVAHSSDELDRRAGHVLDTVPPRPITPDDPPAPATATAYPEPGTPGERQAAQTREHSAEAPVQPEAPRYRDDPEDYAVGERLIDERGVPGDPDDARAQRWRNAYVVPDVRAETIIRRWDRGEETTGFGLSGGGIRSASVALGALQSLRAELLDARHLVSVSGGGYTAGAFQQALTGAGTPSPVGTALRDAETVFGHGTAEFNHVRRHSSYLADTPGELVGALGRVARGLLLSLTVLFGPAVVLGVAVGWFYAHVPITALPRGEHALPTVRPGALVALGVVAVTAYALAMFARAEPARRAVATRSARQLAVLAWLIAAVVLVIPALIRSAEWILGHTGRSADLGGSVGAVVLTYLAALAAMAWRHRVVIGTGVSGLRRRRRSDELTAVLPGGLTQRLLVVATTALLGLLWLLLFGAAAATRGEGTALWTAALALGVVVVLGGLVDVTSLSLHSFYRERLARTFAVRAVRRHGDQQVIAVPYDPAERTTLSAYGSVSEGVRFPEVIFAAAANLKGEHRTPPGLNAVSYTMSAKWTGGPDVGWVRTDDAERVTPARIRQDLTVQGAVALSGAAFASAMGRRGRWYQVLLAVTGARLGAWLPNPAFLRRAREAARGGDWTYPWLPRVRRLPYLLREVFNSHPHHERLLHISDGGHYDNLGLVELLRRRCTLVYCIDASNDTPPSARTLASALALAWQELGVRIVLDDPWHADPGSGRLDAPGSPLSARLARDPIITGTIYYPPESGLPERITGRLVVARAVLWPDLPYSLQSYAAHHPEFPHDSTGDQWFDHGQFAAYSELGRYLGARARHVPAPGSRAWRQSEPTDEEPG